MGEVKYINKQMALDAINGDLPVWKWYPFPSEWKSVGFDLLLSPVMERDHFAIGEKPTSPPRKMIEVNGERMPAPIWNIEDAPNTFWTVTVAGIIHPSQKKYLWVEEAKNGNVYATEADAIAARDGWLKVKKQAMERTK